MVDLLLVRIGLSVTLADTLRNHTGITLCMTSVLAILTLHACRVLEEISAKRTTHDVVELVLYELVSVHLVNLFLALTYSSLSAKTEVDGAAVRVSLVECQLELNLSSRLQVKPFFNWTSLHLRLGTSSPEWTGLCSLRAATCWGAWSKRA